MAPVRLVHSLGVRVKLFRPATFLIPSIDGIKTGIVDLFPELEKLEGVTIAQPRRVFIGKSVWSK